MAFTKTRFKEEYNVRWILQDGSTRDGASRHSNWYELVDFARRGVAEHVSPSTKFQIIRMRDQHVTFDSRTKDKRTKDNG